MAGALESGGYQPLSPREMRGWLVNFKDLVRQAG